LAYKLQPGEGAFYGPKLEFALKDSQGRVWQCGTLQLDFVLPGKLGAKYAAEDGKVKEPVMIHRAILGSMERFIGILLEHYEGRLPQWLAPVQAVIVPVGVDQHAYAEEVAEVLREHGWRVDIDARHVNLMGKIKKHSELLVPNILVLGKREAENGQVSVRQLGSAENILVDVHQFASNK
jgi:threonyl-tRNA synthetase